MASQQVRRENVTDERKIEVEKDRVPKMASHFESLADKVDTAPGAVDVKSTVTTVTADDQRDKGAHDRKEKEQQSSDVAAATQPVFQEKPGGVIVQGQKNKDSDKSSGTGTEENKGHSLEEISQYRQKAQQNSMDAIRAAEERYEKAKNMGASTLHNVKESATHGLGAAGSYATEKGAQAKDTITEGLQKGTQYVADKAGAAKDTAVEKGQEAYNVTKDTLASAGQATARSAAQAKEYVAPKAGEVQEQSKGAASYVGEKAVQVKDATLETGKGAVGYAGKVAETVKDKAVVAGWGAAHYTAEKAVDATKAVAGVASTVAGYAGGTTVAAKDYVADAGKRTAGYAGDKLAAAKDYVVSAEESAAEYAARKKAEAERDLEAKQSPQDTKGESRGGFIGGEKQESEFKAKENIEESFQEESGGGGKQSNKPVEGAKVVLQAIGETIAEIGKTTTDLVAGGGLPQTGDEPEVVTEKESTTIKKA